ncbi:MAG: hypothetical protein Q7V31_00585 [Parvibaculum sp.]|uniref:hypothetical protein n=1 Tax=Parvibaculum sp. TaxID=2024848 RepID=UPI00272636BE|nr:hypothetical protein [Parvibaculum sp.]MDO8837393.1 hypothetical protein [Parvibaculum sp.]
MSSQELDNLVRIGKLKREAPARAEFDGLVDSAKKRLADSRNEGLSPESRFDLAYNAAHAFALAALRQNGYRSEDRYIVFQALVHTVEIEPVVSRVLARCHNERNLAEYQGRTEVDERLLSELIDCATKLETAVARLTPPPAAK